MKLSDLVLVLLASLAGCIIGRLAEQYEWKGSMGIATTITAWIVYFWRN